MTDNSSNFILPAPEWVYRVGIGQDSHRFLTKEDPKPCILGGVVFENTPGFDANSDGDVVFHAICNAFSSVTHVSILGGVADNLLKTQGITDSATYLREAVASLKPTQKVSHLAITVEGKRPKLLPKIPAMREKIANILEIPINSVNITATSGECLTEMGKGHGVQCLCILTVMEYCPC
ncbi:2-C-methyl-D-erythritol 2,4-cyclodiphosphate synthase [Chlamydia sp.]|uniref:2-C-methyl-D-erythritol 2,4-cyclodiphosphate synthase n=1 Tax=Chlamydia sp. TaxID=35827 RepID=UPI0025C50CB6|nr:2-C-methyl-D-erythritol 2,4-cyclodiphosphate synthase [Chlamydia sp.]MBQ8498667.1 2-C-methyl-D-erythritol 2,4-cyclodiphosphate synthase [Chlamydia sp.]